MQHVLRSCLYMRNCHCGIAWSETSWWSGIAHASSSSPWLNRIPEIVAGPAAGVLGHRVECGV